MRTHPIRSMLVLLFATAAGGCSPSSSPAPSEQLKRRFPAQAARILDGFEPFVARTNGFSLEPHAVPERSSHRDGLRITLPQRAVGPIGFTTRQGFTVSVHEVGAGGDGTMTGGTVAYPAEGRTSFWSATVGGYEEWLMLEAAEVRAGAPVAAWDVDGGHVRLTHGIAEICDEAGVPRLRMVAREAFDTSGRSVAVRVAVEQSRIEVWADAVEQVVLVDPEWSSTGVMIDARVYHTATLLADGNVLVAGGDGAGVLATAELYDPETGVFTPTGALNHPTSGHAAIQLSNSKVLVAGGFGGAFYVERPELYDPDKGVWTQTEPNASCEAPNAALLLDGTVLVGSHQNCLALYDPDTGIWTSFSSPVDAPSLYSSGTRLSNGDVLFAGGYDGYVSLTEAVRYNASAKTFEPVADMNEPRQHHRAVQLSDGRVLVTGGEEYNGSLNTAEIYDPVMATWMLTGMMQHAHSKHTATLLPNGKVLVLGGHGVGGVEPTADVFDSDTGFWETVPSMTVPRVSHTATVLRNGKVLVTGGFTGQVVIPSVELYDPGFTAWKDAGDMQFTREHHTATPVTIGPDAKVLVAGGYDGTSIQSTAEIFDPVQQTFTQTGNMALARMQHTATPLANGDVLVTGSKNPTTSAERFVPASGSWTSTTDMQHSRAAHTATLLPDGQVLVAGGYMGSQIPIKKVELYDGSSWSLAALMVYPHFGHTATDADGRILIAGGFINGQGFDQTEVYDPGPGTWTLAGSMSVGRAGHTATRLPDGQVLVAGGLNGPALSGAEIFDPAQNVWKSTGSMSVGRVFHTATLLDNQRVLVTGGQVGADLASCEVYDIATGMWLPASPMRNARKHHTATKLPDGSVLVAGGSDGLKVTASAERFALTASGAVCLFAGDCESGFCVDGVCCNSACGGSDPTDCVACSIIAGAQANGMCEPFDGTPCNDKSACTSGDTCEQGVCTGNPEPDGAACSDGNPCTEGDGCHGGVCRSGPNCPHTDLCYEAPTCGENGCVPGAPAVVCPMSPPDPCRDVGQCDPSTGLCAPLKPNGTACSDGDDCTEYDTCTDAVCSGVPKTCGNHLVCRDGKCPTACNNTTDCEDGFVCGPSRECAVPPPASSEQTASCRMVRAPSPAAPRAHGIAVGCWLAAALVRRSRRRRSLSHGAAMGS